MTLKQIAALGRKLTVFLALFADCFGRKEPRELLRLYVRGQFSDLKHKNAEAIALKFGEAPELYNGFWNRSSGMKKNLWITPRSWWQRSTHTPRRSASLMSLGCPRAESTRRG